MSIVVTLGNTAQNATFTTVDTLTSGTGADTIAFTGVLSNASVDMGAGNDTLTLGASGNTVTLANTETVTGGASDDTITLSTALASGNQFDLAGGNNTLVLANVANTGT